jgi:hypothetical protein
VARITLVKERLVVAFLREKLEGIGATMIANRTIPGGSSKRRPDVMIRFELGGVPRMLIVENDEHQHFDYDLEDEENKVTEMWRDGGEIGTTVIRFNPDAYTDGRGARHPSCFGFDRGGVPRVAPSKTKEWAKRLERLLEEVRAAMSTQVVSTNAVDVRKLFYDGFDF